MIEIEKTCLDELTTFGMCGREEDFMREHYLVQGVPEEQINEALRILNSIEDVK